jgi:hypothetical protein
VFVGHGVANISLIHLVTVPEAKSAYVNVLDLFLISTITPGWFEEMGTNTVYVLESQGSMYVWVINWPFALLANTIRTNINRRDSHFFNYKLNLLPIEILFINPNFGLVFILPL